MVINNNISSLIAYNSLNAVNKKLQKSINSLSTGLRINNSSDDAAGFAISEKIRSQTSGLAIAMRNSQDGVSMLQTAEGALGDINSMLQRMRELAVQASNDSLTSNDRNYIQLEINELRDQVNRIAGTTQFNRKRILDGSSGALWSSSDLNVKARINSGLTYKDQFGQNISSEGNYRIEVSTEPCKAQVQTSSIMNVLKTETDYGKDAIPEEITETVRTVQTQTVYMTEERLNETVITEEEPYTIYINGSDYDNSIPVDNATNALNEEEVEEIRAKWFYDAGKNALRITSSGTFNIAGRVDSAGNSIPTRTRILVDPGLEDVNIFLTDVDIEYSLGPAMETSGSKVNVYLSGTNKLRSSGYYNYNEPAGIQCLNIEGSPASLTISSADGDGQTTGTLDVMGAGCGAGIGGPCTFSNSLISQADGNTGTIY
ncbi:MAG: hypothetical protein IJP48_00865 [Synergistaceae bacterium]|nr:hypothetical protein [Synergistaceae bacterium]